MFQETISALCYEIGDWHRQEGARSDLQPPYNDVAEFVLEQWCRMPDYLRLPMCVATIAFSLSGMLESGRPYHKSSISLRRIQRLKWKSSRFGVRRDLMRFYESLATLALYSRPVTRAKELNRAA